MTGNYLLKKHDEEIDRGNHGISQLHEGAGQKTDKGADGRFPGCIGIFSATYLADVSSQKGPEDDPKQAKGADYNSQRRKYKKSCNQANGAAPDPSFASAELLRAIYRDNVVEHNNGDHDQGHDDQEFFSELVSGC